MDRHDAAVLTLRAMGAYACFRAIEQFPNLGILWSKNRPGPDDWTDEPLWLLMMAVPILLGAIGALLLLLAPALSRLILPSREDDAPRVAPGDLLDTACAAIGVVLVVAAVPKIASLVTNIIAYREFELELGTPYPSSRITAMAIQVALMLLIGTGLFLKGPAVGRLWRRIQGRDPAPQDD